LGYIFWGCYGTVIPSTQTVIGTGAANTAIILANCTEAGIPARLCDTLSLNGYMDWFLPSKDELTLMYVNLYLHDLGGFNHWYYWSSTEFDATSVWAFYFSYNGFPRNADKRDLYYVRAIRSF